MENVYVEDVKVSQEVKLTFLLLSLGRYLCWLTINPRGYWVDTSAGGLLVPDGIILPVVSASALTWFIRYIYY